MNEQAEQSSFATDLYVCSHTRKCGWRGSYAQLSSRPSGSNCTRQICPKCGNHEFYVRNPDGSKKKRS